MEKIARRVHNRCCVSGHKTPYGFIGDPRPLFRAMATRPRGLLPCCQRFAGASVKASDNPGRVVDRRLIGHPNSCDRCSVSMACGIPSGLLVLPRRTRAAAPPALRNIHFNAYRTHTRREGGFARTEYPRICISYRLRLLPVAKSLSRTVPDSHRRMINEFAMDRCFFSQFVVISKKQPEP